MKKHYVNNLDLYNEIKKYFETDIISEKLHLMIYEIATRRLTSKRYNDTNNPLYCELSDMATLSYMKCLRVLKKYDLSKKNPLAWITQVVNNRSFDYIRKRNREFYGPDISSIESIEGDWGGPE